MALRPNFLMMGKTNYFGTWVISMYRFQIVKSLKAKLFCENTKHFKLIRILRYWIKNLEKWIFCCFLWSGCALCSNMEVSQSKHDVQILSHFLNLEKMLPVGNFESPLSMYDLSYCTPSKVSKESYGSEPQNHDLLGFRVEKRQRGFFKTWEHRRVVQTKTHTFERW